MAMSSARRPVTGSASKKKQRSESFLDVLTRRNPRLSRSALKTTDRAVTALVAAAGRLSPEQQQRIVAHEKDLAKAVEKVVLAIAAREPAASDLIVLDVLAPVEESMGEGFGELLSEKEGRRRLEDYAVPMKIEDWAGPVAGPGEIERDHGIRRSTLHDWQKRGAVIGLLKGERKHVFPLAQFIDSRPIEGMSQVTRIIEDPRVAWLWLIKPHPGTGRRSPLDRLKEGRIDEVVAAAQNDFS
jgi:hypothetical protein